MANSSVRAAAEGMPNSNRRTVLRSMLAAGALALPTAAISAPPGEDAVLALWERRDALRDRIAEADALLDQAQARLPWWAASGERYLHRDGSLSGGNVGWPAIQGLEPPTMEGAYRTARPGPHDIRRDYQCQQRIWGTEATRPQYRRHWRDLIARLRAQRSEREKAGVTQASALCEELDEVRIDLNDAIETLPLTTPSTLAARVLIKANYAIYGNRTFAEIDAGEIAFLVLEYLRPNLSGMLRAHVDEIIDNPDKPAGELRAMIGFHGARLAPGSTLEAI
jgi:hypothetical protein